ncbi:MAG: hypothetical protein AB7T49_09760 [Oligoflexales bacterium]
MWKAIVRSIVTIGVLLTATELRAVDLAAKEDGVQVFDKASKQGTVVTTLKAGDVVASSGRKGMFWEVETADKKKGFVAVTQVTRKSDDQSNSLSKAIRSAASEGREKDSKVEQARSRSAVMGVRGLDDSSETSFAGNAKPNLRRVYLMEDRVIKPGDIDTIGSLVLQEIEKKAEDRGL